MSTALVGRARPGLAAPGTLAYTGVVVVVKVAPLGRPSTVPSVKGYIYDQLNQLDVAT